MIYFLYLWGSSENYQPPTVLPNPREYEFTKLPDRLLSELTELQE